MDRFSDIAIAGLIATTIFVSTAWLTATVLMLIESEDPLSVILREQWVILRGFVARLRR